MHFSVLTLMAFSPKCCKYQNSLFLGKILSPEVRESIFSHWRSKENPYCGNRISYSVTDPHFQLLFLVLPFFPG